MPKTVGLCHHYKGKRFNFRGDWFIYTGYFQIEDNSRYYWQVHTPKGIQWLKRDNQPVNPKYVKVIDM